MGIVIVVVMALSTQIRIYLAFRRVRSILISFIINMKICN